MFTVPLLVLLYIYHTKDPTTWVPLKLSTQIIYVTTGSKVLSTLQTDPRLRLDSWNRRNYVYLKVPSLGSQKSSRTERVG